MSMIIEMVIPLTASIISALGTFVAKREYDKADEKKEETKVKEAIDEIQISNAENDNVLELMLKNVKELREYYVIIKQQARKSFSSALFMCFFGMFIYVFGIISYVFLDKDISIISIIGGSVVQLISGLFFWLYREATKQLSIYHKRLGSTEKYLIAYQMICEVPEERKYEEQRNFINYVLNDNQETIKSECNKLKTEKNCAKSEKESS